MIDFRFIMLVIIYHFCLQVVKKAKLTKVVFNPKWPIILVGDDKGVVTSLKLSPNLRKQAQPDLGGKVGDGCRAIDSVALTERAARGSQQDMVSIYMNAREAYKIFILLPGRVNSQ